MNSIITCKPCLIFDALGSIIFKDYCRNDIPHVKEWVTKTYAGVRIDPSNAFFNALMARHSLDELERYSIDRLIDIYPVCIQKNAYVQRFEKELVKGLQVLRKSDFMKLWLDEILPVLEQQRLDFLEACDDVILTGVLQDIKRIKHREDIDRIHISMTYFTWPVSFHLAPGSYLTNMEIGKTNSPNSVMQLFAHELAHRFSNDASKDAYRNACRNDEYLKRTNWFLSEIIGSPGDEEEFVVAIEHAIAVRNGIETYEQAAQDLFERYKSCMPISAILFAEFCQLSDLPPNMNDWICTKFSDGTIRAGHIEDSIRSLMPGYSERFHAFYEEVTLQKC